MLSQTTTMNHYCILPDCGRPTTGRSNKCNAHKLTLRRHGHPEQVAIKATEYGPYRDTIQRLWHAEELAPFWAVVKARWGRCLQSAEAAIGDYSRGVALSRHAVRAAEELVKLNRNVPLEKLACLALALYMLEVDQPRRFKSDDAFRFQLVRKVRGLDELAVGKTWNHKRRKMRRVYRDLPPRVVRLLHEYLLATFGEAAVKLKDYERARPRLEVVESQIMADAVRALR